MTDFLEPRGVSISSLCLRWEAAESANHEPKTPTACELHETESFSPNWVLAVFVAELRDFFPLQAPQLSGDRGFAGEEQKVQDYRLRLRLQIYKVQGL